MKLTNPTNNGQSLVFLQPWKILEVQFFSQVTGAINAILYTCQTKSGHDQ